MSLHLDNPPPPSAPPPSPRPPSRKIPRRLWYLAARRFRRVAASVPPILLEIAVVVLLCVLPGIVGAFISFFSDPYPRASFGWSLYSLLHTEIPRLAAVLYICHRSGVRQQRLGLVRPNPGLDVFGAVAALILVCSILWALKNGLRFACPALMSYLMHESARHYAGGAQPPMTADQWALAGLYFLSVGLVEEYLFRGYLLRRLWDWLGSPWPALAISSLLFSLGHIYQGYYGLLHSFVFGATMALVMLATRRLWIVALAHGTFDLLMLAGMRF